MYHVCLHTRLDGMYLCSRATLLVPYLIQRNHWHVCTLHLLCLSHIYWTFSRVTMNSRSYGVNVSHKLFFHLT